MIPDRFSGLRRVLRLHDPAQDVDDELAFHFEEAVAELVATGMPRDAAEREALRRFGDPQVYRRELHRMERRAGVRQRVANVWWDVRYAIRRMGRSPGVTLAIVLTFVLGIGANATMFSIIDRLLLRAPEGVVEPESVRRVVFERLDRNLGVRMPGEIAAFPDYEDLVQARSVTGVAAFSEQQLTVGRGEDARQFRATLVTPGYFELLGVRPAIGRLWTAAEDSGVEPVAVISHQRWEQEHGGDRSVIGRVVDFGHGPFTIVGVAPPGFNGTESVQVDLWLPLRAVRDRQGGDQWRTTRDWHSFRVIGRLAPGVTADAAESEITALHRQGRIEQIEAGHYDAEVRAVMAPLLRERGPFASAESRVAKWLGGVSLIVLLIACANVANLLLARMIRERGEIGIRLALGVSRGRLLAQSLTESLLLAGLGAAGALVVAYWGSRFIRRVLLPDVVWADSVVEIRVLALVLVLALIAGVAGGLLPWLLSTRSITVNGVARGSPRDSRAGVRLRNSLVVVQAAFSVVLLVGAGLFVRSLQRVESLDHGFEIGSTILINPVFESGFDAGGRERFYEQAVERLNALPGVAGASASLGIPFWSARTTALHVPGLDTVPRLAGGGPYLHVVDHNYFATLGLRFVQGRGWGAADGEGAERVVVVNETMARTLWPGGEPLTKCLRIGEVDAPCASVIGVVRDTRRFNHREPPAMQYYVPSEQRIMAAAPEALLVRLSGEPREMGSAITRELMAIEPALRFAEIWPLEELLAPEARSWTLGAAMFTSFGLLALLVAAVGLYSVLAFAVVQRSHELGIRAALGAGRERLLALVLREGLRHALAGIVLGLGIAFFAGGWVADLLFETPAHDPLTFAVVAVVILTVSMLASGIPAVRATRIDPNSALRAD